MSDGPGQGQGLGQGLGQGQGLDYPKESTQEPDLVDLLKRRQEKHSHHPSTSNDHNDHDDQEFDGEVLDIDTDTDGRSTHTNNPRLEAERLSELFHHPRVSIGSVGNNDHLTSS